MATDDLTVGEVLSLLQGEYPEATMGWIRSIEQDGLIVPARTARGNRLFPAELLDTLRWVLEQQRDGASAEEIRHGIARSAAKRRDSNARIAEPSLFDMPLPSEGAADSAARSDSDTGTATDDAQSAQAATDVSPSVEGDTPATNVAGAAADTDDQDHSVSSESDGPRPAEGPLTGSIPKVELGAEGADSADLAQGRRERAAMIGALQELPAEPEAPEEEATPPAPARVREPVGDTDPSELLTREEFLERVGLAEIKLAALEQYGVVAPVAIGGFNYYDPLAVRVGTICVSFLEMGLEARHLRMYRMAAEREVGLLEQMANPLLKQRNPVGREQARATLAEAARLGAALHAALVDEGVRVLGREPGR